MAETNPADDEDGGRDQQEHDRRVEVRLAKDERADDGEDDEDGAEDPPPVVEIANAACEHVGRIDEERQLGDLARLEPDGTGAEPAARPGDLDPDARNQYGKEEQDAHDEQGPDP